MVNNKKKIAISLITYNDINLLIPCINSLINSDLNNHLYKFFIVDNGSNDLMKDYIKNLPFEKNVTLLDKNLGIVIPRIKVYNEIIKEDFDFLLELHPDMLFPKLWLNELLKIDEDNALILEPHIYQPKKIILIENLEKKIDELYYNVIYNKCRQTHPWLIKLKLVNKIGGYYDKIFSPQQFEDDDFVYRTIKNGYFIKSTGMSWVCHYGGLTRNRVLPSYKNEHLKLFEEKHNILFTDMLKMFEYHPIKA
jgi:GT2 family glycosyltransferase